MGIVTAEIGIEVFQQTTRRFCIGNSPCDKCQIPCFELFQHSPWKVVASQDDARHASGFEGASGQSSAQRSLQLLARVL